ncbi:MAG: LemA family protein [Bacteroidales bacterium]|nr:LemA family protein [Bacteroidales bacterium]
MDKNLNDNSSYEPIEYKIIASTSDLHSIDFTVRMEQLENVLIRRRFLISDLVDELKTQGKTDTLLINEIIEISKNLSMLVVSTTSDLIEIDELNNKLDSTLNELFTTIDVSNTQEYLDLTAQLEGTSNRVDVEMGRVNDYFKESFGCSKKYFYSNLEKGNYIYHKYRAKNGMGAKVINEAIFNLDNNKKFVNRVVNIE